MGTQTTSRVNQMNSGSSILLLGFLAGAIAGIAIGLLISPKPGSEVRDLVRQGVASGLQRVRNLRGEGQGDPDTEDY